MPRKAFVADLKQAIANPLPPHISDLQVGDEDGSFTFTHTPPGEETVSVDIQALVPEVSSYPGEHTFMIFTSSSDVPKVIDDALSDAAFGGICVSSLLTKLGALLDRATSGTQGHPIDIDLKDSDGQMFDGGREESSPPPEDHPDDDEAMEEYYDDGLGQLDSAARSTQKAPAPRTKLTIAAQATQLSQLRRDLQKAKDAGFRATFIGNHSDLSQSCIVLVSCRVAKLGIEDDALKAWGLERDEYIMLLLYFTEGYKSQQELSARSGREPKHGLLFHIGVTKRYKVSPSEALDAFSSLDKKSNHGGPSDGVPALKSQAVRSLFVGLPVHELLNKRLLMLVEYRMTLGMPWSGAEAFYNDFQGMTICSEQIEFAPYLQAEDPRRAEHLPPIMKQDEIESFEADKSFPLIAMQFALRHVVRCTEFCLVCHRRTETDFEALKPFVCSNPLCLFQYMQLGFGPSIEYEITKSPYVVDLLISFAWASAQGFAMKELPLGMNLMVPPIDKLPNFQRGGAYHGYFNRNPRDAYGPAPLKPKNASDSPLLEAKFNERSLELVFSSAPPLKVGTWVVICTQSQKRQHHRVIASDSPLVFKLSQAVKAPEPVIGHNVPDRAAMDDNFSAPYLNAAFVRYDNAPRVSAQTAASNSGTKSTSNVGPDDVQVAVYNQRFDDLDKKSQQDAIRLVLETLPSVVEMKSYLETQAGKQMSLRSWIDRISPSALGILRWVIASNRSCLLQIDNLGGGESSSSEDRVSGMDGFVQFRFAQGAPDKEQRFIDSVRETTQRLKLQHPTGFVWHGSPLHNWHSIIREGLNFDKTSHGRAYGDGVYLSQHCQTSLGYSRAGGVYYDNINAGSGTWPSSLLKVTGALCLNEVVNAPSEFVSRTPHLVVKNVDWIQTRYLFVSCDQSKDSAAGAVAQSAKLSPGQILEQDPKMTSTGISGQSLVIPITAISKSRRPVVTAIKSKAGAKKVKLESESKRKVEPADDLASEATDDEDLQLWKEKAVVPSTDFVPGTLNFATLPLLPPPSYATQQANRTLLKELNAVRKLQAATPAHELGWYLDVDRVENMYQWILELHSFDPDLPLAKDLKAQGLTAVILELRFGASYPHSPPFVRVVRPRFRAFGLGGGGHVTAGGALCMELLTNSGWNVTSSLEAVLLQVRMAMTSTDPRPARLETAAAAGAAYGAQEAMDAYRRACQLHNWEIPKDFQSPAFQVADGGPPVGSGAQARYQIGST